MTKKTQREGLSFFINHYKIYLEKFKKVKTNTISNQTNQTTGQNLQRRCVKKTPVAANSFKSVHSLKSFFVVVYRISLCYKTLQKSCVSQIAERHRGIFTVTQEPVVV